MALDAGVLKQRHRQVRDRQEPSLALRLHRALSWLGRAERENGDADARFLFLWIAFNAVYASEFGFESRELQQMRTFIQRWLALDHERQLHTLLHRQYCGPVRTLIENRYVFEPFWRALREHDPSDAWKQQFERMRERSLRALLDGDTATCLLLVLERLYVLRNQLVHGGATWNSQVNRQQLADANRLLGAIVPVLLSLMMQEDTPDFGEVAYPPVLQPA